MFRTVYGDIAGNARRRARRLALVVGCLTAAICLPAGAYLAAPKPRPFRLLATRPLQFVDIPENATEKEARRLIDLAYQKGAMIRDYRPVKGAP